MQVHQLQKVPMNYLKGMVSEQEYFLIIVPRTNLINLDKKNNLMKPNFNAKQKIHLIERLLFGKQKEQFNNICCLYYKAILLSLAVTAFWGGSGILAGLE